MKRKTTLLVGVIAVALLLSACSDTDDIGVATEVSPQAVLGNYETYSWLAGDVMLSDYEGRWTASQTNTLTVAKTYIDREMRAHGYRHVAESPDLFVVFTVGVDMDALEITVDPAARMALAEDVPTGALSVGLIDTSDLNLLWIGSATGDVKVGLTEKRAEKRVDYAVKEMFKGLTK